MPGLVIARVHLLPKNMPAYPIFIDRNGRVIGDVINDVQYNDTVIENKVAPADTPGVHTVETQAETTGVNTAEDHGPTPSETVQDDLDFAPVNPPLIDTPPPVFKERQW